MNQAQNKQDLSAQFIKNRKKAVLFDKGKVKIWEFGGNETIDSALAEIEGNYPEQGFAVNTMCDMFYLVVSGKAVFYFKDSKKGTKIKKDCCVFIPKNVPYKVETTGKKPLKVWMPSSPAWTPEQYRTV